MLASEADFDQQLNELQFDARSASPDEGYDRMPGAYDESVKQDAQGGVDTYRIHKTIAARVTRAR